MLLPTLRLEPGSTVPGIPTTYHLGWYTQETLSLEFSVLFLLAPRWCEGRSHLTEIQSAKGQTWGGGAGGSGWRE